MLAGKRILITGVLTDDSIAWHVARVAQEQGAEVALTGFGRAMRLTARSAKRLPKDAEVFELDINEPSDMMPDIQHLVQMMANPAPELVGAA